MRFDALVLGGGPAGASVAIRLARAGRAVGLVEREPHAVHKVCGEFISAGAETRLRELGVDLDALGAVPIDSLRFFCGGASSSARLPFHAWSLSRRVLDEALLRRARKCGVTLLRGEPVEELSRAGAVWTARLRGGRTASGAEAFVATGKHDLRGFSRPPGLQNDLVALKMHFRLRESQMEALRGQVELLAFEGGYAGLQLVEGQLANLCLVVRLERFAKETHHYDALLRTLRRELPHLAKRLEGAEQCAERPCAVAKIPYGHVLRAARGPYLLGDQAAVVPSFCGEGIANALHSGTLAAESCLAGESVDVFQRRLAHEVSLRVVLSTGLSTGLVRPTTQWLFGRAAQYAPRLLTEVALRTRLCGAAADGGPPSQIRPRSGP